MSVPPDEAARLNNLANFTSQDKTAAQITAAINKAKGGYNQALQNIINNQRRYDLEINQLKNLRQAGIEAKNVAKFIFDTNLAESCSAIISSCAQIGERKKNSNKNNDSRFI